MSDSWMGKVIDEWKVVERPGQSGARAEEIRIERDRRYGVGRWKNVWAWEGNLIERVAAFEVCEVAYYEDSFRNEDRWRQLALAAKDVYDHGEEDVNSGMDYTKQGKFNRFHDIAIRRVMGKRGWEFEGTELIKIRYGDGGDRIWSNFFDPLKVPFHAPSRIVQPMIIGKWNAYSVESFYQSNKYIVAEKD
ncbi:MAG: hypothetical protein WC595_05255 [Candidatus Nanoarchaeia archaeon]